MIGTMKSHLNQRLQEIEESGLYKSERIIINSQGTSIRISTGEEVLNFCANNYLGLADHPELIRVAKETLDRCGYGMITNSGCHATNRTGANN